MEEHIKQAFAAAQDLTKQLLTLSTAIIGAIVTFSGQGAAAFIDFKAAGWPVPLSMIMLLLSMIMGFCALMSTVGALSLGADANPNKPIIRLFAGIQIVLFFLAVLVLAVFAPGWDWDALRFWAPTANPVRVCQQAGMGDSGP